MKAFKFFAMSVLFALLISGCKKEDTEEKPDYASLVGVWTLTQFDKTEYVNGVIDNTKTVSYTNSGYLTFTDNKTATLLMNNVTYQYTFSIVDNFIDFHEISTGKDIDYNVIARNVNSMILEHTEGTVSTQKIMRMTLAKE